MDNKSLQDKFPCMSQAEKTARCLNVIAATLMPMLADALTPKPATFADFTGVPSLSDEQV
ncbi:MAG: hypothetical protein PW788_02535 [Micavibrio sp.]|nr:hypothetical protein [Micavibrio sp.]